MSDGELMEVLKETMEKFENTKQVQELEQVPLITMRFYDYEIKRIIYFLGTLKALMIEWGDLDL